MGPALPRCKRTRRRTARDATRAAPPTASRRAQPQVRVVLERVDDRPLGLGERARRRVRRLGQGPAERRDHEGVRVFVEREGVGLAGAADDAARRAGEADEVLALAAGGAAGQVRARSRRRAAASGGTRASSRGRPGPGRGRAARARWPAGGRRRSCGSPSSKMRATASHARAAPSSAARVLAQARVRGDRLDRGDGQQVAAALVEHEVQAEERLEAPAEPRLRLAHALSRSRSRDRESGYTDGGCGPLRRSGASGGRFLRFLPIRISHYTF